MAGKCHWLNGFSKFRILRFSRQISRWFGMFRSLHNRSRVYFHLGMRCLDSLFSLYTGSIVTGE